MAVLKTGGRPFTRPNDTFKHCESCVRTTEQGGLRGNYDIQGKLAGWSSLTHRLLPEIYCWVGSLDLYITGVRELRRVGSDDCSFLRR